MKVFKKGPTREMWIALFSQFWIVLHFFFIFAKYFAYFFGFWGGFCTFFYKLNFSVLKKLKYFLYECLLWMFVHFCAHLHFAHLSGSGQLIPLPWLPTKTACHLVLLAEIFSGLKLTPPESIGAPGPKGPIFWDVLEPLYKILFKIGPFQ